jgi:hypothetical protein
VSKLISLNRNEPAPNPPGGQQTVLEEMRVRLYDNRHLLSLPFDDRSTGFRWFFSFLVAFSSHLHYGSDDAEKATANHGNVLGSGPTG